MCVMPIACEPLLDEIRSIMHRYEIKHHNKGVENGMILEMLMAEFLAGSRVPTPDGYSDPRDP